MGTRIVGRPRGRGWSTFAKLVLPPFPLVYTDTMCDVNAVHRSPRETIDSFMSRVVGDPSATWHCRHRSPLLHRGDPGLRIMYESRTQTYRGPEGFPYARIALATRYRAQFVYVTLATDRGRPPTSHLPDSSPLSQVRAVGRPPAVRNLSDLAKLEIARRRAPSQPPFDFQVPHHMLGLTAGTRAEVRQSPPRARAWAEQRARTQ